MSRKSGVKGARYVEDKESDLVGWDFLAAEIVRMAYCDFLTADRKMRETLAERETLSPRAFTERMNFVKETKREVRKFFRSKWYSDLCSIDRERFLRKLDEVEATV